ncbi:Zn-dependent hydrolase [Pseudooceanicola sp. CBS1P-1]|uniref:Hydantoinase/carbamoylase family amidase n=1 Tax=Pseudooceanicola albus TaxID=2692189 RepID=A0A6L7G3C4_9RHOB|nr:MULTISPECIES: Zn-dependent hydrolase [Pseudooceanicola]MBT9385083.1 Zn-dependent hydrolase [Pseudooceanicola endophyticus]MXN18625.1 hydantoinase/carbamoylase family amidase [Pseudooceanicola albus]
MTDAPLINPDRLWKRLMDMARIGAIPGDGVNRQSLSAEDRAAMACLIGWGRAIGLTPAFDRAGNLFLTMAGTTGGAPVLIGSHLDSQPTGGRFDGVYGVLAAFEALETLHEAGITPPRPITLVAWMNEEGSRFAPGMMGSEVFAGVRTLDQIRAVTDAEGISVGAELDVLAESFAGIAVQEPGFALHAYLEPHIEQADHLEATANVIGAVTGIQGKKTFEVTILGQEAHAGTEPMARRRDAVQAFARVALAMQEAALAAGEDIRFTIGRVEVLPNAPSVVPARVRFRIDLRHPENAVLDATATAIEAACDQAAPCEVQIRPMVDAPANAFAAPLRAAIRDSAKSHGFPATDLLSAAGHDARHMAPLAPSAMIFVPCRGGLSHHPDEWADPAHLAAGAQVLLDVCLRAAATPDQGDLS